MSEMGLEHFNSGFLLHVFNEQSENNELNTPGIRSSMDRWWANCIRNEGERQAIRGLLRKVHGGGEEGYTFTRSEYEKYMQDKLQQREVPDSL